ncbi:MAG: translation initiation factor IF-2 subunit beta [Candidatus Methanomethylophilus sp.]|nr:translation initiation factor IF-2 subunit beta [Methanomethylophilus sp.]MDD3232585.1 translation initiation factor IF-2 subunit beta [Methanomethylophilus sp.]MDD4221634.1 translation initiation factor IF-2 subunit beta [Methanomethylophilus sp.]MDD4668593.1 translation initiation factor IF-2 subunit beta [Methanomethylophilus sp.]
MEDDNDYLAMLDRGKEQLPETTEQHERFELPPLEIIQEGKITIFKNFIDVTDKLRRDPQHVLQFLLKELGTPGNIEGRRVVFKAKINPQHIDEKIKDYTETYVICSECGRPDTHMEKEDRTFILVCEACGARRPIMVRKAARPEDRNVLHVGNVIEVSINDVGKKGDGVGKYLDYLVIVPGTARGTRANVKITNISAKTAFGQVTAEAVNH